MQLMHCLAASSERCLVVSLVVEGLVVYCEVSGGLPILTAALAVCLGGLLKRCETQKERAIRVDLVSIPEVHLNCC